MRFQKSIVCITIHFKFINHIGKNTVIKVSTTKMCITIGSKNFHNTITNI